jgi:ANTAR domain/S-adenosyl methyltransferase
MRLRDQVIGALNLFRAVPGALAPADIRVGQALADVATISLLHERSMRHSDTVNDQLQTALNSRVIIEQAKGKLAERLGLDMDQAFSVLRDHARTRNLRLSDVALAFIDGSEPLHAQALLKSTPPGATDYLQADLRDPGVILRRAAEVLDFGQPAADRWDTRTRAAG